MKFVSALKQTDYANRLREIEKEKEKLRQRFVALKNEQASIVNFLHTRAKGKDFQFNGADGYLMQLSFIPRTREDLDRDKVAAFYEAQGKRLPLKRSSWLETKISYVKE